MKPRLLLYAAAACACLYLLTAPARIENIDGQVRFEVAWSLLQNGGRDITLSHPHYLYLVTVAGRPGKAISFYGLGHSLAALPLMAAVGWLGWRAQEVAFSLLNPLVGGAVAAAYLALLLRLGHAPRRALLATALLAVATPLWPAADTTMESPLVALCLLLLALACLRRQPWLGGLALGGLGLLRENDAVAALPLLVLLLAAPREALRQRLRAAARVAAAGLPALLIYVAYNLWRYGSPLSLEGRILGLAKPGLPVHGDLAAGLYGLLLSGRKGLVWYCPTVLLCLWGAPALWRRHRGLATAIGLCLIITLGSVAGLSAWGGAWSWGPRYLYGLVPLLHVAVPEVLVGKRRLAVAALIAGIGVAVQVAGVSVQPARYHLAYALDLGYVYDLWPAERLPESQIRYNLRELPEIVAHTAARMKDAGAADLYTGQDPAMAPATPRDFHRQAPLWAGHYAEFDSLPWFWVYWDLVTQGRLRILLRALAAALLGLALLLGWLAVREATRPWPAAPDRSPGSAPASAPPPPR